MPKSKSKRKGLSSNRPGAAERASQARYKRQREAAESEYTLLQFRNNLPLGHELNQHKIEGVFGPLEIALEQARDTGEFPVDDRGKPSIWDTVAEEWKELCDCVANMCWVFGLLGVQQKWEEDAPPGLAQLAKRLDYGMLVTVREFEPAFDTIRWMRERVATVTPNQWTDAFELACKLEAEGKSRTSLTKAA